MRSTFFVVLLLAAPSAAGLPLFGENDAGTGGDAGDTPPFAVPIERGIMYAGDAAPLLDADMYLFEGYAGERVRVLVQGVGVCADVRSPNGTYVGGPCDLGEASRGETLVELEANGTQQIIVSSIGEPSYRFGLDVLGDRLLPNNDAGTGHDAPDVPSDAIPIEIGAIYEGDASSATDLDIYAFHAEANTPYRIVVDGALACIAISLEDDYLEGACADPTQSGTIDWTAPTTADYHLELSSLVVERYRFGVDIATFDHLPALALDLDTPIELPARGNDPTCGTGLPVTATSGEGEELDGLVFAALKTGFRAVVAWRTEAPVAASLMFSLDGGDVAFVGEAFPRTQHVFVLDSLPEGATLCFMPEGGASRAILLANAMNAFDAETGAYTANLLLVANTQPTQRGDLETSLPRFAQTLRDMTDGHVQAGRMILVYGDPQLHHQGINACYLITVNGPGCSHAMDVVYTYDSCAGGAACTTLLGVKDRQYHVWMSSVWQANAVAPIDDTGRVLAHEMGHYLLGALDLYGSLTAEEDCWDPSKGLSVMGGDRDATELDDEVNRCPNEAELGDYVPSWTLFRAAYPNVPERDVIDAGPTDAGAAFSLHVFEGAPGVREVPNVQNDAGTGGDAPEEPDASVRVEPGVVYDGTALFLVDRDVFAFTVRAGDRVDLASNAVLCGIILDEAGISQDTDCSSGAITHTRWIAPADGTWYFLFEVGPTYRFAYGVNQPATIPVV